MRFLNRKNTDTKTPKPKRRKPQPSWVKPVLRANIAFAALAICVGASAWVWQSGMIGRTFDRGVQEFYRASAELGFQVVNVNVAGRDETDARRLLKAIGVSRGDPILALDLAQVRERVTGLPWVKQARIVRRLPDEIFVELEERSPIALRQSGGELVLMDDTGEVIPDQDLRRFRSLPIVIGKNAPTRAKKALAMLSVEPELVTRVKAISWVGDRRWTVHLKDGIDVQLPEVGADQAWTHLATLQRDHGVLKRDVKVIDLRIPDQLIVRMTPDAEQRLFGADKSARGKDT